MHSVNHIPKVSAGMVMYRRVQGEIQVLLVHPGGPFCRHKDNGAWSIPKGQINPGEEPLAAARREFTEETGVPSQEPFIPLTPITQRSGKIVHAWAFEGDCEPQQAKSNMFSLEWPPHSGRMCEFPEIDRAGFFNLANARQKLIAAQVPLIEELVAKLAAVTPPAAAGGE